MSNKLNIEMGARNGAKQERAPYDFYATDPKTVEIFLNQIENDGINIQNRIWECACGLGHISEVLKKYKYEVYSTDIIARGYGNKSIDFLKIDDLPPNINTILTNPPYKNACEFVLHALDLLPPKGKAIMYLKDRFLEGKDRYKKIFKNIPPRYVYCHVDRQKIAMGGEFLKYNQSSGSQFYIWCIWEKGYTGETNLRWIRG